MLYLALYGFIVKVISTKIIVVLLDLIALIFNSYLFIYYLSILTNRFQEKLVTIEIIIFLMI